MDLKFRTAYSILGSRFSISILCQYGWDYWSQGLLVKRDEVVWSHNSYSWVAQDLKDIQMFADMDNQMLEKNQRHHSHEMHSNRYHAICHNFLRNMILDINSLKEFQFLS